MSPPPDSQVTGRRSRRTASRDALKASLSISAFSRADTESPSPGQHAAPDVDYMEPAIEGPPSPERLRQLSKQMKRASYLNRPRIQRAESAGTSPRRAMERSPWEQAFENISLSRPQSKRSNTSSDPSHERHERDSVQFLGKNLFQRSNKMKRESSSYSSSNSSLHSAELPVDVAPKDSLLPSIFMRRKPSRDETAAAQRRLQISGPFNFQHVAHTQRGNAEDIQQTLHVDLASDTSVHTPGPATAPGALQIDARDFHHFHNKSIDSIDSEYYSAPLTAPPSRPAPVPRHTAPVVVQGRAAMKFARSQDQLRTSPPRSSPRSQSPTIVGNVDPNDNGPVPPPRVSSRQSLTADGFRAFASASSLDRPRTSGGFRQPQPFDPSEAMDYGSPPATAHGFVPPADFEAFGVDSRRFSHALTTPDDAAWPLCGPSTSTSPSPYDKALPDVPEEEEHATPAGKSRLSLTSSSSLRGSQSVPLLRSFSESQRPTSGASDTLGPFDTAAAQRRSQIEDKKVDQPDADALQDNWEDVIDYCYEHEAEANFNYEWERPSLDSRRDQASPIQVALADDGLSEVNPTMASHRAHLDRFQERAEQSQIAPAMTGGGGPPSPNSFLNVTSSLSLPRGEKGSRVSQLKGIRPISYASSFRESHGFNLSPSLLIPGDYHQQMLAEKYEYHDEEILGGPFHDELSLASYDKSPLSYQQRSSTSTTATNFTEQTDTTGERHVSANSILTTMTRLTVSSSSTSLNKAADAVTESTEPLPIPHVLDINDEHMGDQELTPPATKDTVPELASFPVVNFAKKPYHRPHASESLAREELAPQKNMHDLAKLRRPRARTSSLSAQIAPPVGQYAIFPRSYVKETGDRI